MTETSPLDEAFKRICSTEAPLSERLALFTAAVAEHGKPFALAYKNLITQISNAASGNTAPAAGEMLPFFLLPDHGGHLASLESFLTQGPLVVSFNRGHWCEYCELELRAFTESHAEFAAHGAQVVSIMPERGEYTRKVRQRSHDTISVLSDIDNGYALSVGIVMWLGDEVCALYRQFGLDIERYQGNDTWFVPIPATFVLNRQGVIVARKVDPDFRSRMDIEEILLALKSAEASQATGRD
jgi:peroxiredoxin